MTDPTDDRDPNFKGWPAGHVAPARDTPEMAEQRAAKQAAYEAAIAQGLDEATAREEGAKAAAACWRRQRGMPELEPSAYDDPSKVPAWKGRRRRRR